jgi:hypothetical protein
LNIYTQRFRAKCASNNRTVEYTLTLEASSVIMVEDLQAAVATFESGYHEDFADKLFAQFGGKQTIEAHHHGTDIKTVRP